ncbi:NAD(P)-binding protein [Poronia punctata]|nr:NAD(P)-binding protein [Poronia punctata]
MTSYDISGKNALVTGGGSGICLAFVELLLNKGCSVIIGDLALTSKATALTKEYPYGEKDNNSKKPYVLFHETDVTSWKDLSSLWTFALSTFNNSEIDLVVPGAGVYEPPFSSFWHPPGVGGSPSRDNDNDGYATFDINLVHPIRLAQLAIGHWTTNKQKGKSLLFVSSIAGHIAAIGTPFYYSSKAGLHSFVKCLAGMREKVGIRVMAIAPGVARTPLWEAPHLKDQLPESEHVLPAETVAKMMLDMWQDEQKYGDAEIIEIMEVGTAEEPKSNIREVPMQLLLPQVPIAGHGGILKQEEKVWNMLATEGLRVTPSDK